jgi:glycosyltransferase involved in cell wall biosynthesis
MLSENLSPLPDSRPACRRSLRICVVTETFPPEVNGVATTAAQFIEGLRQRSHEILLVRPRQGTGDKPRDEGRLQHLLTHGLPIPRYPALKMGLPAARMLGGVWSRTRPDVVHIVTEGPLGWSALVAATKLSIPVVSDFRTNFHAYSDHYGIGWLGKPILAYLRNFHNRTLRTMVPTEAIRRQLANSGFQRVEVISRGVNTTLFNPGRRSASLRAHWGAELGVPVVMHVGRLAPEKNLGALASSFETVRERAPAARFVVVGDGPGRRWLEQRCPYVLFAGMRTGEDLAAHYASGDIFVFPSLTETYGNVTVEAMASGLAVVAFDHGAAHEHIVDGRNGRLAAPGDEASLAREAVALSADLAHATALGGAAAITAQALSWDRVVGQLEAVLLDAVRAPLPSSGLAGSGA